MVICDLAVNMGALTSQYTPEFNLQVAFLGVPSMMRKNSASLISLLFIGPSALIISCACVRARMRAWALVHGPGRCL